MIDVDLEQKKIFVKPQNNLALLDQVFTATIQVQTENGYQLSFDFSLTFISDGPAFTEFDGEAIITCSDKDKGFSFTLPSVFLAE